MIERKLTLVDPKKMKSLRAMGFQAKEEWYKYSDKSFRGNLPIILAPRVRHMVFEMPRKV